MRYKRDIENAGLSGLTLDLSDVARVSRSGRVLTLRHTWPDGTDARIWGAVRRTFVRGAQTIADRRGKSVEVYSSNGNILICVEPASQ